MIRVRRTLSLDGPGYFEIFRHLFSDFTTVKTVEDIRQTAMQLPDGDSRTSLLSLVHTGDTLALTGSKATLDDVAVACVIHLYCGRLRRMECALLREHPSRLLCELRHFGSLLEIRYTFPALSHCCELLMRVKCEAQSVCGLDCKVCLDIVCLLTASTRPLCVLIVAQFLWKRTGLAWCKFVVSLTAIADLSSSTGVGCWLST